MGFKTRLRDFMRVLVLFAFCNMLWLHSSDLNNSKANFEEVGVERKTTTVNADPEVGNIIDNLNGVNVYYNGSIKNVIGRNLTGDGYNLGLKYQCVEFVKRYYYERFNHKMPNTYGHAKEFYKPTSSTTLFNHERGLMQYANGSRNLPKAEDIVIFKGNRDNPYGHIGIIASVSEKTVEMVQQNVGQFTRNKFQLLSKDGHYYINESEILGWLRR